MGRESDLESSSCTCSELDREGRAVCVCGGGERRGQRLEWISRRKGCDCGEEKLEIGGECGRSGGVIVRAGDGETGACLRHCTREVAEGAG